MSEEDAGDMLSSRTAGLPIAKPTPPQLVVSQPHPPRLHSSQLAPSKPSSALPPLLSTQPPHTTEQQPSSWQQAPEMSIDLTDELSDSEYVDPSPEYRKDMRVAKQIPKRRSAAGTSEASNKKPSALPKASAENIAVRLAGSAITPAARAERQRRADEMDVDDSGILQSQAASSGNMQSSTTTKGKAREALPVRASSEKESDVSSIVMQQAYGLIILVI